jgi:phospholipid-binding lipoprotein MlaA
VTRYILNSCRNLQISSLPGLLIVVFLTGCAISGPPLKPTSDELWDPFEPVNRGTHALNTTLDEYILEPVARGYEYVIPESVQGSIRNVFDTFRYPSFLVSDVFQFKFTQAACHTGRFLVNATIGVLGIFDVATDWGLPRHYEDFGIALAFHDIPPGPYVVLPLFGPSTVRDALGRIVDGFLDPFNIFIVSDIGGSSVRDASLGAQILWVVQTRSDLIEAVKTAKAAGIDYYNTMQSGYYQYRQGVLYDGEVPSSDEEINEDFTSDDELGSSTPKN